MEWDGSTLSNRARSLSRSTRKHDHSNKLVFLCSPASGYCRKLLIYSLGSTTSRHYCRRSKGDLVVLLPAFSCSWLRVWAGHWALRLWSASSTQPAQLSPSKEADGSWDQSHPWHKPLGFTEVGLQLRSSQGSGPWLLICIAICSAIIVSCKVKNKYAA